MLAEGVGFIHSLENIEQFSAEWQTLARIVPLYCLMILRWWQTGQGGLIERVSSPDCPPNPRCPQVTQKRPLARLGLFPHSVKQTYDSLMAFGLT